MNIPKIIHQTWKDENVPLAFSKYAETWKEFHPDWEYRLWTDEMNEDFIELHFPDFRKVYHSFAAAIQRVDAVRYFILYKFGGMFVDMDFECLRNFEPLLKGHSCIFGKEPDEHCRMHNRDLIICNALMAAVPGNEFFKAIFSEINAVEGNFNKFDLILESTGPFMLSRAYHKYPSREDIHILNDDLVYPFTKNEVFENVHHDPMYEQRRKGAYAIHYYAGTWWKEEPALKNISPKY